MNENLEYPDPEETFGTKAAREIRAVCNKLTDKEREIYLNKSLDLIYKDCPAQDPRKKSENKI